MILDYLLFLIGFYILIKGADFLTEGASILARKLNVSEIVIGLVIVGIGTSIPEFATTLISNLTNKESIGLGTVIGSNIFNILFILGISAIIKPLIFKKQWVDREMLWNILAIAISALTMLDGRINQMEGIILLFAFGIWLDQAIKKHQPEKETSESKWQNITWPLALGMILGGFIGVIVGGQWVVNGGSLIARNLGFSEKFIGLTIIGIGTSLPELAVSLVGAIKNEIGIVIGNIIGSNIFDFLMILGISALMKPITVEISFLKDTLVALISTVLLYFSMFIGQKYLLKRWQGILLILGYLLYFIFLLSN